jgi:hypothetical protein
MISFALYRLIHFIGIVVVFLALGGTLMHVLNGGTRETSRWRKPAAIGHGIALFVILLGGFGMMARMGVAHGMFPGWIWAKLAIWILLGAAIALPYRAPAVGQGAGACGAAAGSPRRVLRHLQALLRRRPVTPGPVGSF